MTKFEAALLDMASFLDEQQLPYMIIGGFANLHWGVERFTRDIDITAEVVDDALPGLIESLQQAFQITRGDLEFAKRNRLVRLRTRTGVDVDLILAALPYESAAIRRAHAIPVGKRTVRICSPEDLIIHKLASERTQDLADVEGVVTRQAGRLDLDYLRPRVRELARGLERPEIEEFLERTLRRTES